MPGRKNDNKHYYQQGSCHQHRYQRFFFCAKLHIRPFIPAGKKIDKNSNDENYGKRKPDIQLFQHFLFAKSLVLPKLQKIILLFCKHNSYKDKIQEAFSLASAGQNVYLTVLNLTALKLASLLAQFLYTNKRLDLPGIGSLLLDPSVNVDGDNTKPGKVIPSGAISFENNPLLKESPDLVLYISSQTGKIKALAAADLDSHLNLIQQFINIGKPFLLEGIGNLVKIKSGEYAFTQGDIITEKKKEFYSKEIPDISSSEESLADYKSIFYGRKGKNINWRKPAIFFLVIAGIALAVWGGYTVYKVTSGKNKSVENDKKSNEEVVPVKDSTMTQMDSVVDTNQQLNLPHPAKQQLSPPPWGTIRFVLEDAKAKRAFERFAKLKTFQWPVQMATKDSVYYILFVELPASAADTSRILDSLTRLNGRKVYIEQ